MSAIKDGRFPIMLDKERHLLFSLNAIDEMQDKFGGFDRLDTVLSGKDSIKNLRWLLTVLLNEGAADDEEPLTEKQVGKLIHTGNFADVKAAIFKSLFYGISRESLPECGERKRKYDKVERKKAARAPQGESIEERPQEINDRQTFGHWEGDCVCGKKRTKETLFVLSERLTRNEIIIKMPDQTAASVVAALNKLERRFGKKFSQIFKSITFDNGSEFMDCAGIEKSIYGKDRKRTKVYYCHPYSAYERGTNENINKMIRRFLPKGTDFRKVTAAYIQRVETWINNYPREILGFETSGSLFERYVAEAA